MGHANLKKHLRTTGFIFDGNCRKNQTENSLKYILGNGNLFEKKNNLHVTQLRRFQSHQWMS